MAAKKLSTDFPPIVLRAFETFEGGYRQVRDLGRVINTLRRSLVSAINDHESYLTPETGTVAPTSTPDDVNKYYLDTIAKDMYVSVGTASSADWKKITP